MTADGFENLLPGDAVRVKTHDELLTHVEYLWDPELIPRAYRGKLIIISSINFLDQTFGVDNLFMLPFWSIQKAFPSDEASRKWFGPPGCQHVWKSVPRPTLKAFWVNCTKCGINQENA